MLRNRGEHHLAGLVTDMVASKHLTQSIGTRFTFTISTTGPVTGNRMSTFAVTPISTSGRHVGTGTSRTVLRFLAAAELFSLASFTLF